ncbi:hypothetical protein [Streptomyces sp. 1222.5]
MEVGDRIGGDHKSNSRWEYAHTAPDLTDLPLIADTLRSPLAHLVK